MMIAVVGCNGLVGSALCSFLSTEHQIVSLDRESCDVKRFDIDKLAQGLSHVDCIINCAATLDQSNIEELLVTNAVGALNVAKLANKLNAKLIHLSSISCEQNSENQYFEPYGISKLAGEMLIKDYCHKNGSNYCIVRCSQIYDLDLKAQITQPFFYNLIFQAKKFGKAKVYGSVDVKRNYVSLETVVKTLHFLVENNTRNFGYILGETLSISDLVRNVSVAMGKRVELIWGPSEASLKTIYIPDAGYNFSDNFQTSLIKDLKEIANRENS